MKSTQDMLFDIYRAPTVRLAEVCALAGVKPYQARFKANRNLLPFPAFRLNPESPRSQWMVHLKDIADHIDSLAEEARENWLKSQL